MEMRNEKWIYSILLLMVSMSAVAQVPRLMTSEMHIGAHAGISTDFKWNIQPTGGFVFEYMNQKFCGLQVEANYRSKYIDIPMLMHLNFGNEKGAFIINLGPQIGAPLAKQKFYYGITGGLGGEIRTRKAGIFDLDVRFLYGFAEDTKELAAHLGWYWPLRSRKNEKLKMKNEKLNNPKQQ